jgi:hypothetical protein
MPDRGVFRAVSGAYREAIDKAAEATAWTVIPIYMIDDSENERAWNRAREKERAAQCEILRDIVPFQPVQIDPELLSWRDGTAVRLAEAACERRSMPSLGLLDAESLALLADALEEAGCTEKAILEHLRGSSMHYLGCWVVNLVLGKK